jgi:hypothetical protein
VNRAGEAKGPRRKYTFLVNLWLEPGRGGSAADGDWRGSVEHLASGRRLYFNHIASLVGFLTNWLGRRDAEVPSTTEP